jgi:hypothetical protein
MLVRNRFRPGYTEPEKTTPPVNAERAGAYSLVTSRRTKPETGGVVSESAKQWFQGCAIGCGALVVVSIFLLAGFTLSMRGAFEDAREDRDVLVERFGAPDDYTPAVDGCVPGDRLIAFLAVREAMAAVHAEVASVDNEMGDFDALAEDGDPPMRVALPAVARLTKAMLGLPKVFGEIEKTRNSALVEAGMGLGEYTYIYAMSYHDQLVDPEPNVYLFGGSAANGRVRDELRGMIRRQLETAEAESPDDDAWSSVLAAELASLETDEARIPWEDGLPPSIAVCIDPFRERLDATYSAAAAEFDLLNSEVKRGGLAIEMR